MCAQISPLMLTAINFWEIRSRLFKRSVETKQLLKYSYRYSAFMHVRSNMKFFDFEHRKRYKVLCCRTCLTELCLERDIIFCDQNEYRIYIEHTINCGVSSRPGMFYTHCYICSSIVGEIEDIMYQ